MTSDFENVLEMFIDALEGMDVPYFLTGSVAMLIHGNVRMTHDVDIAFDGAYPSLARRLRDHIGAGVYVDVPDGDLRPFNAIAATTGYKVDFWPITDDFGRSQLVRRVRTTIAGRKTWVASVEDLILSKLRWYAQSESPLQRQDLFGLISLHHDSLDHTYLNRWADALRIRHHLEAVWNSSSPPSSS